MKKVRLAAILVTALACVCAGAAVAMPGRVGQKPDGLRAAKGKEAPVPRAEEKAPPVAWGKEVGGLQAGLTLRPGQREAMGLGEPFRFVVRVRNAGKVPVTMKHVSTPFETFRPTVRDRAGNSLRVFMQPFVSRFKQRIEKTLKPDEEAEVGNEELALGADGGPIHLYLPRLAFAAPKGMAERPQVSFPTVYAAPATYRVSYRGFIQSHPLLSTGELKLEAGADGVRLGR